MKIISLLFVILHSACLAGSNYVEPQTSSPVFSPLNDESSGSNLKLASRQMMDGANSYDQWAPSSDPLFTNENGPQMESEKVACQPDTINRNSRKNRIRRGVSCPYISPDPLTGPTGPQS